MIAGKDNVAVIASRRLESSISNVNADVYENALSLQSSEMEDVVNRHNGRSLLTSTCYAGDTNGDGVFDISDVVYLQYAIGGAYTSFTNCQVVAMDPDLNGIRDGVDIQYLLRVITKKYRFLKFVNVQHVGLHYNVSSYLLDDTNKPVAFDGHTSIRYDISATDISIEKAIGVTSSNGLLRGTALYGITSGSFYITAGSSSSSSRQFNVAIIVNTFDSTGATSSSRQFSFYCSPSLSSCTSVYGSGLHAFIPFTNMAFSTSLPTMKPTVPPTIKPTKRHPTAVPTAVPSTLIPTSTFPTSNPSSKNELLDDFD